MLIPSIKINNNKNNNNNKSTQTMKDCNALPEQIHLVEPELPPVYVIHAYAHITYTNNTARS